MIRRVLEILLIKSYENLHIEHLIKNSDGTYSMLEKICSQSIQDKTLNLSKEKKYLNEIRELGNYAAHKILYNTTKNDLDSRKPNIRVLFEELLYKAGFVK